MRNGYDRESNPRRQRWQALMFEHRSYHCCVTLTIFVERELQVISESVLFFNHWWRLAEGQNVLCVLQAIISFYPVLPFDIVNIVFVSSILFRIVPMYSEVEPFFESLRTFRLMSAQAARVVPSTHKMEHSSFLKTFVAKCLKRYIPPKIK
jgi:hypothetical protein